MTDFDTVTDAAIASGEATDAYFLRVEESLRHLDENPRVVAEVTADQFPDGEFEVFAGLKDAAALLEGRDLNVYALREGQLFDGGPVMLIEGPYLEFARLETSLLGFLSHASGFATAALEARLAAPETPVFSFGARHVHPSLAAAMERSALIGGVDGFSHVAAGNVLGREASGTMPHALMISLGEGEQERAWRAFDEAVDDDVPRIALCDTFTDEVDEVMRAVDTLGDRLDGVRLDTTGSRRGDFRHIIKEVRWALSERNRDDVDIFVSGGLGADELRDLRDVVDGFGVGSFISNANPVDFSLDIVEREGESISKRGKLSGKKKVFRADGEHVVVPADEPGPVGEQKLFRPLIEGGEVVREFSIDRANELAELDAERVGFTEQE